jgi:predicted helicase
MVSVLEDQGLEKDTVVLSRFYANVKNFVTGIDTPEARQKIIVELYDSFFKVAFKRDVERLGIVYTPVEVVDFIVRSVAKILEKEFGRDISNENVHVLDPFTGTGTFITRLIQSGLLGDSLTRKYLEELHANEIVLLAYYIASINIESVYQAAVGESAEYRPFKGICFADTFQLYKNSESEDMLKEQRHRLNSDRVEAQKLAPVTVIMGNPPYSAGQGDANKNAKNQPYPPLDADIAASYAARSKANNKNSLYDSYIRAIFWAGKRLSKDRQGVIAYVSNAGWIDGNAMDGMRKCLSEEFSKIYIFNLRGNCRSSGELRRKEAGNVFGEGSRTPVSITFFVKNPAHEGPAEIYYSEVEDYLNREQKLKAVSELRDIYDSSLTWKRIEPNEDGDWISQRSKVFSAYLPLGDKKDKNNYIKYIKFFKDCYSRGIATSRDNWCYNSSKDNLQVNIIRMICFYNNQRISYHKQTIGNINKFIDYNTQNINWSDNLIKKLKSNKEIIIDINSIVLSLYRPYFKNYIYFNTELNERTYKIPKLFPTSSHENIVICVSGIGVTNNFSCLISDIIPDLELIGKSQCFPRYYYEEIKPGKKNVLPGLKPPQDDFIRRDAVTDEILDLARAKHGAEVSKDDLFYYVYGFLHSEDYRSAFSADLKKSLPRLPLVDSSEDFWSFAKAGRELAGLHLNYETVEPFSGAVVAGEEKGNFIVDKIRFAKKGDKTAIQYNRDILITGVPLEAYDYVVNGRSAIEWILDRYQVKVDKDSGIKNDPNDWAKEHGQPRYILDLLLRVITVSLETMKIIRGLPPFEP